MKKIIITGATGQDGSYMAEYLLENTKDTILLAMRRTSKSILDNLLGIKDNPRVRFVTMDLNDQYSISNLIRTEQPDYFINLGAQTFVADSWNCPALHMETNAISLIHILEAVRQYAPDCRTYSSGSSEQFGNVQYSPQDEKHPMSPRSIYGVSKCAASHICKVYRESYNLYVVHGVLFNHESKRRQKYFITRKITDGIGKICRELKEDPNGKVSTLFCGNLNSRRDWSHAADFVDGIWRMMNQEKYRDDLKTRLFMSNISQREFLAKNIKEYVLSSDETHSIKEFASIAFDIAGIPCTWSGEDEKTVLKDDRGRNLIAVSKEFFRPAEVELLIGSSTLARTELGWKPKYSFKQLIEEMVKNDLANG